MAAQSSDQDLDYRLEEIRQRSFDRPTWKKTIEGLDYFGDESPEQREERIRQAQPTRKDQSSQEQQKRRILNLNISWLALVGKVLIFLIATGVLFLLLRAFIGLEWRIPKRKAETSGAASGIDLEQIEADIDAYDLGHYIEQALNAGQYDLAIRLRYLSILKALSGQGLIEWKKEKTNRDYLAELNAFPRIDAFRRITRIFEEVWYGQHHVGVTDYRQVESEMLAFLSLLSETSIQTAENAENDG